MTKGSDLLVAALEREGADRIFGVPGEENLDTVESLRASSIELVLTRHEQGASSKHHPGPSRHSSNSGSTKIYRR